MKADVKLDKKTCKRTEGAAAAERVMIGDKSSAQIDTDPTRLTIFDNDNARPPAFVVQWMTPWRERISPGRFLFPNSVLSSSSAAFVFVLFRFVFLLSLMPRPLVQSFLDMHAPRHPHAVA